MKKLIVTVLVGFSNYSYADLGPQKADVGKVEIKENKTYRLDGDLSYLFNTTKSNGESNNKENLAANIIFQRKVGAWGQELRAEAISAKDNNDSNANVERYMLSGKILHRSTNTVYQFVKLQGDKDLSSHFDHQMSLTGGMGVDIYKDKNQTLIGEAGMGYRYSKEHDMPYDDLHEMIGTIAVYYEYKFNDKVRLNQDLSYEFGDKSQIFRSRSSIGASLTNTISAIVSYQIKDTQADVGNSRDSLLSVGLKYIY